MPDFSEGKTAIKMTKRAKKKISKDWLRKVKGHLHCLSFVEV
jgi:hypothetical protein